MVGANTKDGIIMVKSPFSVDHVCAYNSVEQIDILDVLSYITASYMESLQIWHGHNNDIRVHLHHQRD